MDKIEKLIQRVQETQHGFLNIQSAADEFVAGRSMNESLSVAERLFTSEAYQVRSLATFILGRLAAQSNESLKFLKDRVSLDDDWRVQEILAKAFDRYCFDNGYEQSLPVIKEWISDSTPNVRRSVTEGLRIWTGRPYFRDHPEIAVQLLSQLRNDESAYVRKSVGNSLRDISKKHKELIKNELQLWDTSNKRVAQTYKLASKFINKKDG
ncbi:MAG: DNA alkylation repair enzyme [Candidatus Omnitrophica bacterium CG11_big_fil_rev_8_21_14_0_20_42_13]|uniref:DNA alkylation repair enzyme n=1 Tax=Candidatus Ghiorseimicrobium undicola TaxID=1974746 RepID=A0A2H0LV86_9BACT|nr:MAG: DNA alkylation repair enzyme [Candidatus Omnitrophica bacterium CG11_big_fil_rev_8_21_14_0_20_42_13]